MKITEVITKENAVKPPSPEQVRINTLKQSIDRQKLTLAQAKERQQNAKHNEKIRKLQSNLTK
jgi:hypothetical protein